MRSVLFGFSLLALTLAGTPARADLVTDFLAIQGPAPQLLFKTSANRTVLKMDYSEWYDAGLLNYSTGIADLLGDPLIWKTAVVNADGSTTSTIEVGADPGVSLINLHGDTTITGGVTIRATQPSLNLEDVGGARAHLRAYETLGTQYLALRHINPASGVASKDVFVSKGSYLGINGAPSGVYPVDIKGSTYIDGALRVGTSNTQKVGGSNVWTIYSDERLKKDIRPYTLGLAELQRIKPVTFQYNGQGGTQDDGKVWTGVIAQEVEKVSPAMVSTDEHTGFKQLDSSEFTYMIINAVKEIAAENAAIRARIEALEKTEAGKSQ